LGVSIISDSGVMGFGELEAGVLCLAGVSTSP